MIFFGKERLIQYCFTQDSIQNIVQFKEISADSIQKIIQFISQGIFGTGRIGKSDQKLQQAMNTLLSPLELRISERLIV